MTEANKRIAIIGGTAFLAILLLLFFRRGGAAGSTIVNGSPYAMPAVAGATYGSTNFGPVYYSDAPWTFELPGLDLSGPDLSMIGACCSDCQQSTQQFYQPQYDGGNTYVFNAPDQGPNVYNYYAPAVAAAPKPMMYASFA